MDFKRLIGTITGTFEQFHLILDNWHVPRIYNGVQLDLQQRAGMLLKAIEQLAPELKQKLRNHVFSENAE